MNKKMTSFSTRSMLRAFCAVILFLCACSSEMSREDSNQNTSERSEVPNSISASFDSSIVEMYSERSGVSNSTNSISDDVSFDPSAVEMYKEILLGETTFFSVDAQKNINLSQLNQAVSTESSVVATVSQFAVLDLDGDESMDIVLRLTVNGDEYYGYEILRYQDNAVYGYTRWYRAFRDLKTDGSFLFSGGAFDNGYGFLQFDGAGLTRIVKAESRSNYDDNNNFSMEYFVDGESSTEEDYFSAMNDFLNKQDVTWHDFTTDNLSEILQG